MNQKESDISPLVSIVVVTYNSSKYVIETLDSAFNQTYNNIELIITDDCSNDETVDCCKVWLENHKNRFTRTEIVIASLNTGIPANCNRGLKASKGEWIKFIAGDDMLTEEAINDFIKFIKKDKSAQLIFGRQFILKNNIKTDDSLLPIYKMSQNRQYKEILKGSGVPSAAAFIKLSLLKDFNGFDEKYKYMEDGPLWIRLSEMGIYFHHLNKNVVIYRIHETNTSIGIGNGDYIKIFFYLTQKKIFINEVIPRLKANNMWLQVFLIYNKIFISDLIIKLGNKKSFYIILLSFFDFGNLASFLKRRMASFFKL